MWLLNWYRKSLHMRKVTVSMRERYAQTVFTFRITYIYEKKTASCAPPLYSRVWRVKCVVRRYWSCIQLHYTITSSCRLDNGLQILLFRYTYPLESRGKQHLLFSVALHFTWSYELSSTTNLPRRFLCNYFFIFCYNQQIHNQCYKSI